MRKRTIWPSLLVIVAIFVIGSQFWRVLDRVFAPWAFERDGRPPLSGSWVGAMTTATGLPRGVFLDVYLPDPKISRRGGQRRSWREVPFGELAGTLTTCDEAGREREYTIEGEPEDRQASRLHFYATPIDSPIVTGLRLAWVKGRWDRGNRLELDAGMHWHQNGSAISGPDYPDTQKEARVPMARGGESEFRVVCDRVRQRSASAAGRGR